MLFESSPYEGLVTFFIAGPILVVFIAVAFVALLLIGYIVGTIVFWILANKKNKEGKSRKVFKTFAIVFTSLLTVHSAFLGVSTWYIAKEIKINSTTKPYVDAEPIDGDFNINGFKAGGKNYVSIDQIQLTKNAVHEFNIPKYSAKDQSTGEMFNLYPFSNRFDILLKKEYRRYEVSEYKCYVEESQYTEVLNYYTVVTEDSIVGWGLYTSEDDNYVLTNSDEFTLDYYAEEAFNKFAIRDNCRYLSIYSPDRLAYQIQSTFVKLDDKWCICSASSKAAEVTSGVSNVLESLKESNNYPMI